MSTPSVDYAHFFDYLLNARARLLDWVRGQPSDVYTRSFPIGLGTIRATLVHIAAAEVAYVRRLSGKDIPQAESPFTVERQPEFAPFVKAWMQQAPVTRETLANLGDPTRVVEFMGRIPKPARIRATAGGIAGQVLFHEVHHRAQVMAMLRQSGAAAENLDYSVLMWERTPLE